MSYASAKASLLALAPELATTKPRKFDLEHMRILLRAMGNPERRFAAVLVAGTNGKGSTAATLASILRAAGYAPGLYTSPHLISINERIQVDGEAISDAEFAEAHQRVETAARELVAAARLPQSPSFFEILTAMAFEHFASIGVRIAVLEVGMGGRLDATNAVEPCLSVITDVALDHQKYLGDTLAQIAREKAGIIRRGIPVVTLPQHPDANDVIGNTCLDLGARAVSAVEYVPPVSPGGENNPARNDPHATWNNDYPLTVLGTQIRVRSPLGGRHQLRNVALAIAAAVELKSCGFPVTAEQIERGISETRWPGRLQIIWSQGTRFILDVAHNPAGVWTLRAAISQFIPDAEASTPLVVIFGAMRDKAIAEMTEILFPVATHVIATRVENPRAASPEEILEAAARTGAEIKAVDDLPAAIAHARDLAGKSGTVLIAGSVYLVGAAMELLQPGPAISVK